MFEPSTPGPRIMPDCLESNQCYVRSYVGGGEIPDLSTAVPPNPIHTFNATLKSRFLSTRPDTHLSK